MDTDRRPDDDAATPAAAAQVAQDNATMVRKLVVVALVMFGFGWALIPLYRKICEVTGINILTDRDPRAVARAANDCFSSNRLAATAMAAPSSSGWMGFTRYPWIGKSEAFSIKSCSL